MNTPIVADDPQCRRRIYIATWKFRIGQAVYFGGTSAVILSRSRTAMGREIYNVWISGACGGRPYRSVLGGSMKEKPAV